MINKSFTLLWLAKLVSQMGDKFYAIALAWWILQITNSPFIMGFYLFVSVLPGILLGFFAGALTDRWQKTSMLVITDVVRGSLVLAISYLSMVGMLEVWHIFVITILLSLVTSFFDPTVQAIIPEIVEKDDLTKANSMSQMVSGLCMVVGPLLGAAAVSAFGLTSVFLANSVSFFVASFLACLITPQQTYAPTGKKTNIWQELREGIDFIKNQKRISLILKIIAIAHLFVGSLTVSLPFLANGLEGNGVNNLGYLEMMMGGGLLAGSVLLRIKNKTLTDERILVSIMIAAGICLFLIGGLQFLSVRTLSVYLAVMTAVGASVAAASIFWQSWLQNYTPEHLTGRVFSVSTLIGNTSLPIAYALFGALLNLSSLSVVMTLSGLCLTALCCHWFLSITKSTSAQATPPSKGTP